MLLLLGRSFVTRKRPICDMGISDKIHDISLCLSAAFATTLDGPCQGFKGLCLFPQVYGDVWIALKIDKFVL